VAEIATTPPLTPQCMWSSASTSTACTFSCTAPTDAPMDVSASNDERRNDNSFVWRALALSGITILNWRDPTGALTRRFGAVTLVRGAPQVRVRDWRFFADVTLPTRTLERLLAEATDLVDVELRARKRFRIAQDDELFGRFAVGGCDR
jgi:hypothetical protein